MSRRKLREDKRCLNCGTVVEKRFCPECGQENVEPNPHFICLFVTFFQNMFGYDSALWRTLKVLFSKPGDVTKEYLSGKRKSFVPPIRLYLLSSFLLFFAIAAFPEPDDPNESFEMTISGHKVKTLVELDSIMAIPGVENEVDSIEYLYAKAVISNPEKKDSILLEFLPKLNRNVGFNIFGNTLEIIRKDETGWYTSDKKYQGIQTTNEFDRIHNSLNESERMNWIKKMFARKAVKLDETKLIERTDFNRTLSDFRMKNYPKYMFFYLPVFAFVVWLFHGRRSFYKSGVFTLYYFSFLFLLGFSLIMLIYGLMGVLVKFFPGFYNSWIYLARGLTLFTLLTAIIFYFKSDKKNFEGNWRKVFFRVGATLLVGLLLFSVFLVGFNILNFLIF